MKTEGVRKIEIKLNNGETFKINKVIFAEALKENLLSLRKFAEMELGIYLDNKKIDILDPISPEKLLSGVYKKTFWEIELEINDDLSNDKDFDEIINKDMFRKFS